MCTIYFLSKLTVFYIFQNYFHDQGLLIIDEKSMIGHSVFVNMDKRLREARPAFKDKFFGGLSIILLGDWKQLPPVADTALFNKKTEGKKQDGYNLYRLFTKSIIFDKIQRQDGDDQ